MSGPRWSARYTHKCKQKLQALTGVFCKNLPGPRIHPLLDKQALSAKEATPMTLGEKSGKNGHKLCYRFSTAIKHSLQA